MKTSSLQLSFAIRRDVLARVEGIAWDLWWSWQNTQLANASVWAFAIPAGTLRKAGVKDSDVVWLVTNGLLMSRHLRPTSRRPKRRPDPNHDSFVALTDIGATLVEQYCFGAITPFWDPTLRALTVNGQVIKEYRQPSTKQELVLAAFQEDGWPRQIDDPLPRGHKSLDCDPKGCLRKVVENLNRAQHPSTVFFSASHNGEAISWMLRHASRRCANRSGATSAAGHRSALGCRPTGGREREERGL
jgi:hypothetical protein